MNASAPADVMDLASRAVVALETIAAALTESPDTPAGFSETEWYPIDELEQRACVPRDARSTFRRFLREACSTEGLANFSMRSVCIRGDILGRVASQAAASLRAARQRSQPDE